MYVVFTVGLNFAFKEAVVEEEEAGIKPVSLLISPRMPRCCEVPDKFSKQANLSAT